MNSEIALKEPESLAMFLLESERLSFLTNIGGFGLNWDSRALSQSPSHS